MTSFGDIHIGQLIKTVFDESGMTVAELARQIHLERTTIYSIFERPSVDAILLVKISKALNHNFLADIEKICEMPSEVVSLTIRIDSLTQETSINLQSLLASILPSM